LHTIAFWTGRAISENRRLAPGQGRFRVNEDYRAFRESVAWAVKPHAVHYPGPVCVRLMLELNPRMDAQNVIKPVLDALQDAGVLKDDRQVQRLSLYREDRRGTEDTIGIIVTEV
jgi:Holliday junction resolvase RusA-like endonuclease